MYSYFRHSEALARLAEKIEEKIAEMVREIEMRREHNGVKVLRAFQEAGLNDSHFAPSTGYGYDDQGREVLEEIYARVMGAEAALVRPHIVSGTHAISTALFGLLRPGDELLIATGQPYDSLHPILKGEGVGSLKEFGISTRVIDLTPDGRMDMERLLEAIQPHTRVVMMQRSRGYAWRHSFSVQEMLAVHDAVKKRHSHVLTFVDNCYGEFVEELEPTAVGIDLMAGSLIKNPGGGIAPTGGYIAGKREWVERAAHRLTAPGLGSELGSMQGTVPLFLQGLFLAPQVVGEAVKGAVFASALMEELGYTTQPHWSAPRTDLIQAIRFGSEEDLITFCQSIQACSPVNSQFLPEAAPLPGYRDPVIMAAGTFIQGGSLELSADGPIRPPYIGYLQGGLTYAHVKYALLYFVDQQLSQGKWPHLLA